MADTKRYRSAVTGKLVTEEYALANPDTTVGETIEEGATDALIEHYCEVMHDAYEEAAVGAGWETNPESRVAWADVPESNKETMRAAVRALVKEIEK